VLIAKNKGALNIIIYLKEGEDVLPQAIVLINTELGMEKDVVKKLKTMKHVKGAYASYGLYDVIAEVEANDMDQLKDTISFEMRRLGGVRSTLTLIVIEAQQEAVTK